MEDRLNYLKINRYFLVAVAWVSLLISVGNRLDAGEPDWIWTPKTSTGKSHQPVKECYFRKKLTLVGPQKAQLVFTAGDEYEIYLNGQLATQGQSFGEQVTVDVSDLIEPGVNLIAARVRHYEGVQPGIALKFRVKERNEIRWRSLDTDNSWKTRVGAGPRWKNNIYNDLGWIAAKQVSAQSVAQAITVQREAQLAAEEAAAAAEAQAQQQVAESRRVAESVEQLQQEAAALVPAASSELASELEQRLPQLDLVVSDAPQASDEPVAMIKSKTMSAERQESLAATPTDTDQSPSKSQVNTNVQQAPIQQSRFKHSADFDVQQIMTDQETGSVIAMAFNEFGRLLLSQENGPLMIADTAAPVGAEDRIRVYCDQVNSCQGILPLNGSVYVTGSDKSGLGLFELKDTNNDGKLSVHRKLLGFAGNAGENGPHGIQLGPDGMLYVVVGNGCQVEQTVSDTSPYQKYYADDVVSRYQDPNGYGRESDVAGGTILRVSLDGEKVQRVAGGMRDAYDLIVDDSGEIFLRDSNMQPDSGTTWYRPTMAFHVPPGAEMGWRSGWAKFPSYFIDQLPSMVDTGTGSPTGAVQYNHVHFPPQYHGSLFFADWSEGSILAIKPEPNGAGFTGKAETFLQGRPLNVCDLAVGEDGGLYFCTGGRNTEGGVYRIQSRQQVPAEMLQYENELVAAIRHPQPQSAWARQHLAQIRIKMGDQWGPAVVAVAEQTRNQPAQRLRALQLLSMFGPAPSNKSLESLAADSSPMIRGQVARMCVRNADAAKEKVVLALVKDNSPYVRRVACESCINMNIQPPLDSLVPMLSSHDRIETLAARRLLERIPVEQWEQKIFKATDKNLFCNGSVAMLTAAPTLERSYVILAASSHQMDGFLNDQEFIHLLRTVQLALVRGEVQPGQIPGFTKRMMGEFPTSSSPINRELTRILGYLKAGDFGGRLTEYVNDPKVPDADKVHASMYLLNSGSNLMPDEQVALLDTLENARNARQVGSNYAQYAGAAINQIGESIANSDTQTVLANGHRWPKTVLTAIHKLPIILDAKTVDSIIQMDRRIVAKMKRLGQQDAASRQVRLGVIALLARDGSDTGMNYLRELWQREPQRRSDIVIGLAQQPEGKNWAYLVGSLPELDDHTAVEVLQTLASVQQRPQGAKYYRQVIELGHKLRGPGALDAAKLLSHWSGQKDPSLAANPDTTWQTQMQQWSQWYQQTYPDDQVIATGTADQTIGRYSVAAIADRLYQQGLGDPKNGRHLFTKANCAACHRIDSVGNSLGPHLGNLARRYSIREAVEATIDPSASTQNVYQSKIIVTIDGVTHQGMAVQQADGSYLLLDSTGRQITIAVAEIQSVQDSSHSSMPERLLDKLSIEEVSDLMAYLMQQPTTEVAEAVKQPAAPKARISAMPAVQPVR